MSTFLISSLPDANAAWNLLVVVSMTISGLYMVSLLMYVVPILYLAMLKPQNLREKYGNWAVVTGGSSGIGLALVRLLASQGVNVFIVALDDALLLEAQRDLSKQYPSVEIRSIGVNLGDTSQEYMQQITEQTEGVEVSILINNAGFLVMGFFNEEPIDKYISSLHCNAMAAIRLTHHFYSLMATKKIKGCIMFTSSAAWFLPAPFASSYGASKALLSHFGNSLAIEAQQHGIDVTIFHPSYTHSNLYRETPKLDVVTFLSKFGWTPEQVAKRMFACAGRVIVHDMGFYAVATNLLGRFWDSGFLTTCIIPFRDSMAPKKTNNSQNKKTQ